MENRIWYDTFLKEIGHAIDDIKEDDEELDNLRDIFNDMNIHIMEDIKDIPNDKNKIGYVELQLGKLYTIVSIMAFVHKVRHTYSYHKHQEK